MSPPERVRSRPTQAAVLSGRRRDGGSRCVESPGVKVSIADQQVALAIMRRPSCEANLSQGRLGVEVPGSASATSAVRPGCRNGPCQTARRLHPQSTGEVTQYLWVPMLLRVAWPDLLSAESQ